MRAFIGAWLVVVVVACSGAGGPCAQRTGTYRTVMSERPSGACGRVDPVTTTIDRQPTEPPAGCTGFIRYADQNCFVETDTTCPVEGGTMRVSGYAHWLVDGRSGSAVQRVEIQTPTRSCVSTYDVRLDRL